MELEPTLYFTPTFLITLITKRGKKVFPDSLTQGTDVATDRLNKIMATETCESSGSSPLAQN